MLDPLMFSQLIGSFLMADVLLSDLDEEAYKNGILKFKAYSRRTTGTGPIAVMEVSLRRDNLYMEENEEIPKDKEWFNCIDLLKFKP